MLLELLILVGAFLLGTGAAELLGASNLGISISFGAIAFTIALIAIMLRRP